MQKHIYLLAANANLSQPISQKKIVCGYQLSTHNDASHLSVTFDLSALFSQTKHAVNVDDIIWHALTPLPKTAAFNHDAHNLQKQRSDFLWESTCLEVFLTPILDNKTAYIEINAASDGQWNAYFFQQYRQPDVIPPIRANISAPKILAHTSPYKRTLQLNLSDMYQCIIQDNANQQTKANLPVSLKWLVNITAVIKTTQHCYYYAQTHANPADFHDKQYWYQLN